MAIAQYQTPTPPGGSDFGTLRYSSGLDTSLLSKSL
jgi:hypothetical protein